MSPPLDESRPLTSDPVRVAFAAFLFASLVGLGAVLVDFALRLGEHWPSATDSPLHSWMRWLGWRASLLAGLTLWVALAGWWMRRARARRDLDRVAQTVVLLGGLLATRAYVFSRWSQIGHHRCLAREGWAPPFMDCTAWRPPPPWEWLAGQLLDAACLLVLVAVLSVPLSWFFRWHTRS